MFRCPKCDHELKESPAPGTPCPICGTEVVDQAPPELDPAWVAEKAAKQAAAAAEPARPSRKVAVVILTSVMVAVLVVIVVMVMQRQPTAKGEALGGVEITITAPRPTMITIDGVRAGKTPQAIKLRGRTRPIEIRGNGVTKTVTPDRDQTINLVP